MDRISLVSILEQQVGLSTNQALNAMILVFEHAKEECPVLRGNINNFFLDEELSFLERNKKEDLVN